MILELLFAVATFNVCWENPTENIDGTAIDDLERVMIYYGPNSQADEGVLPYITDQPGAQLCSDVQTEGPGDYHVRMTAIDRDNNESGFSNMAVKSAVDTSPQGPIIVDTEQVVYTVVKQPNRFVLLPIGTVPPGTTCDPNNTVNGHMVVPTEDVVWTSETGSRPVVVVAPCRD